MVNKLIKIILAVTGAFSIVFDFATPILLAVLITKSGVVDPLYTPIFIGCGLIATFYRGIKYIFTIN